MLPADGSPPVWLIVSDPEVAVAVWYVVCPVKFLSWYVSPEVTELSVIDAALEDAPIVGLFGPVSVSGAIYPTNIAPESSYAPAVSSSWEAQ